MLVWADYIRPPSVRANENSPVRIKIRPWALRFAQGSRSCRTPIVPCHWGPSGLPVPGIAVAHGAGPVSRRCLSARHGHYAPQGVARLRELPGYGYPLGPHVVRALLQSWVPGDIFGQSPAIKFARVRINPHCHTPPFWSILGPHLKWGSSLVRTGFQKH